MESWISGLARHGYPVLFIIVFLEALGLPIPAALALLIAGAAAARGTLHPVAVLGGSIVSIMLGDVLMFVLGRRTGWSLLTLLCRLSFNPESCVLRSADSFYRRGRMLLVIAKFIPGINTMAPPLAGSMNMRFWQFLGLDFWGSVLYAGAYLTAGFIGSDVLGRITSSYQAFGTALSWGFAAAVVVYLAVQAWMWSKSRAWRSVPYVLPADAARAVSGGNAVIYDVRSHGYYDPGAVRIEGSRRLDPNTLTHVEKGDLPAGKLIYLYCT
jgi:membrane protein DedA with SNARE-associated domain